EISSAILGFLTAFLCFFGLPSNKSIRITSPTCTSNCSPLPLFGDGGVGGTVLLLRNKDDPDTDLQVPLPKRRFPWGLRRRPGPAPLRRCPHPEWGGVESFLVRSQPGPRWGSSGVGTGC